MKRLYDILSEGLLTNRDVDITRHTLADLVEILYYSAGEKIVKAETGIVYKMLMKWLCGHAGMKEGGIRIAGLRAPGKLYEKLDDHLWVCSSDLRKYKEGDIMSVMFVTTRFVFIISPMEVDDGIKIGILRSRYNPGNTGYTKVIEGRIGLYTYMYDFGPISNKENKELVDWITK